ncbi:MAG: AMP-dependent synthetase [Hyphomicrobiales bacterium]|nr:MAG: AMP-dependent synthetase [Hyphomicrobiales bacterium]
MTHTAFQSTPDSAALDPRESRSQEARAADQTAALQLVLEQAKHLPYYTDAFGDVELASIKTIADLEQLPILRKNDLIDIQAGAPPFGGLMPRGSHADYLFVSPGPIHEPGFRNAEFWRAERSMRAVGFQAGDIIHNTFSYHLTPGAWILDAGAQALGCSVIPAGNAPIEQQLLAIYQFQACGYCGTPDFLKTLVEAYLRSDRGPVPIKKALVTGGALTPGLREFFDASGIHALQCYATAELGLIAYETSTASAMVVDEDVLVEIVDPETGKSMPHGQVGEVVVTTLRKDYPLIRFGTGDLSAFVEHDGVDGRTGPALQGWLGRADQAAKVRGMFVRPSQISALCQQVEGMERARLVIDRANEKDELMLCCEFSRDFSITDQAALQSRLADIFRNLCHLRTKISIVPHGSMPDDGQVIVDMR